MLVQSHVRLILIQIIFNLKKIEIYETEFACAVQSLEQKAKMIDETVSLLLFSGDFIRPSSDAEMVAKQKLASYELYCKISKAKGVVELTAEEAALVKQAAAVLNPSFAA